MSNYISLEKDAAKKITEYIDNRNMKELDRISMIIKVLLK